jgi:hypothetical protein
MKHRSDKYIASSRTYPGPQPYKLGCSGSRFHKVCHHWAMPTAHPPALRSSTSPPIHRNSTIFIISSQSKLDSSVTSGPPRTPSSSSGHTCDGSPPSLPKPILPLIKSIASPSNQYHWGFSSTSMANSLRAGPVRNLLLVPSGGTSEGAQGNVRQGR